MTLSHSDRCGRAPPPRRDSTAPGGPRRIARSWSPRPGGCRCTRVSRGVFLDPAVPYKSSECGGPSVDRLDDGPGTHRRLAASCSVRNAALGARMPFLEDAAAARCAHACVSPRPHRNGLEAVGRKSQASRGWRFRPAQVARGISGVLPSAFTGTAAARAAPGGLRPHPCGPGTRLTSHEALVRTIRSLSRVSPDLDEVPPCREVQPQHGLGMRN